MHHITLKSADHKEQAGVGALIRRGNLFISHDADRESPAWRLFYKDDLQRCAFTVRHLETKIAVAL